MNAGKIFTGLIILSCLWIISCDKELVSSGFPTVVLNPVSGQGDELTLSGLIMKSENGTVDETGFIWQIEEDPLIRPGFGLICPASEQFDATVNFSLKKDKIYIVRAYARCGENMIYSEKMDFTAAADFPCTPGTISPDNGYAGDIITIKGKGFNQSLVYNTVMFDNEPATITDANDSVLKCIVPNELKSAGPKTIKVYVNGVESVFAVKFTYKIHEYPVIQSVSRKTIRYGNTLELYGKFLNNATRVILLGNSQSFTVTPVYYSSDTLKIEIYNQENPYLLPSFTNFRIGLM